MDTATEKETEFTNSVNVDPSLGWFDVEVIIQDDKYALHVDGSYVGAVDSRNDIGDMVQDAAEVLVDIILANGNLHCEVEDMLRDTIDSICDDIVDEYGDADD